MKKEIIVKMFVQTVVDYHIGLFEGMMKVFEGLFGNDDNDNNKGKEND